MSSTSFGEFRFFLCIGHPVGLFIITDYYRLSSISLYLATISILRRVIINSTISECKICQQPSKGIILNFWRLIPPNRALSFDFGGSFSFFKRSGGKRPLLIKLKHVLRLYKWRLVPHLLTLFSFWLHKCHWKGRVI